MSTSRWPRLNRKIHYWGAIICALPVGIVIVTGLFLQFKKQSDWVQPATMDGTGGVPIIAFEQVLEAVSAIPEVNLSSWEDIDRLDVRPGKGVIKIRGNNHWEVQIDQHSAEVLQVAYRRSDIIESIHDGSFFHEAAKLWIFLPAAMILLGLWGTGLYLFVLPMLSKRKKKLRQERKKEFAA